MSRNGTFPDVLTLAEAARYLRVPQATVRKRAQSGDIPGQQIDKDWRFLKSALQQWLSQPSSRSVLLSMAGAFKDDETLPELRKAIYAARGRPEVDPEEGE
jgi:excisionase family DNA binding protein